jgi:hypothetical protein
VKSSRFPCVTEVRALEAQTSINLPGDIMKKYKPFIMLILALLPWLGVPSPAAGQQLSVDPRKRSEEEKAENKQLAYIYSEVLAVTKPRLLASEGERINKAAREKMLRHHTQMKQMAKNAGGDATRAGVYAQIRKNILKPNTGKFIAGAPHNFVPWLDETEHKFDWRDKRIGWRVVTPVREQGSKCQTCWAFAAVAAFESNYKMVHSVSQYTFTDAQGNTLQEPDHGVINFSEQALINGVSGGDKNKTCDVQDNTVGAAFNFIERVGLPFEVNQQNKPVQHNAEYTGTPVPFDATRPLHKSLTWGYVFDDPNTIPRTAQQIRQMKEYLLDHGPLAAMVYLDDAFKKYKGGIFEEAMTNNTAKAKGYHWVLIVGWDETVKGKPVWIIKNSFGQDWGEDGFMRIKMGANEIGMAACWVKALSAYAKLE